MALWAGKEAIRYGIKPQCEIIDVLNARKSIPTTHSRQINWRALGDFILCFQLPKAYPLLPNRPAPELDDLKYA